MTYLANSNKIEKEFDKLDILYGIERITKLLLGAAYRANKINPYDYCYNAINSKLV